MLRVLHVNDYPPGAGGGAEIVLARTVALLEQAGVSVRCFTGADVPARRQTPWGYIDNRAARQALAKTLDSFGPDVVHLHNFYHVLSPGILATLADARRTRPMRVVMTAHDYHLACPNSGGSWFHWFSRKRECIDLDRLASWRYLLSRSWDQRGILHSTLKLSQHAWSYRWRQSQRVLDLAICPSKFVQRMLAPLGVPTCWLPHPAPQISTHRPPRSATLEFVFAGRIEPEKGLYELLADWPTQFQGRLTVIGAGADLGRCRRLCAARGLERRVDFLGRLPHREALTRIAGAHVLVQPSRVLETYGLTLLEALAHGTNVLAANRGAAREIIADAGVGFLYDLDDPGSLARQLAAIEQRFLAGTLNRFVIAAFLADRSEERHVAALLRAYQSQSAPALRLAS